jgi:hypothetical protein
MARADFPARISGFAHERPVLPRIPRKILIAIAVAVAFAAAALLWSHGERRGQARLERLSATERAALYRRTLSDLELCATSAGAALGDHCAHQAELISAFPECDAACRELAAPWKAVPTR